MRNILSVIFGVRALIVIVILLASILFGADITRANAEPTPEPTPTATTPAPEPLPTLCAGLADPDENCTVEVELTPSQLEKVSDATVGITWALAVMVFCSIVVAICTVRGTRT